MANPSIHRLKTCTKCGASKPATEEFFHKDGSGLKGKCRPCRRDSAREDWAERTGAKWREQYSADPSKRLVVAAAWRAANKEKCAEYSRRKYQKIKADPKAKLSRNVSCYVYQTLKGTKSGQSWQALLGYTVESLKSHLERQFTKGMTWANYGEWHIDHIRPVSSFNFSTPRDPEFHECWALSNLQPLWAIDNIRKADKRAFLI